MLIQRYRFDHAACGFAAATTFLLANFLAGVANADWPLPRGNPASDGYIAESLPANLSQQWEIGLGEAIETTPVIAGQRLFVTDVMGSVYAVGLDGENRGKQLWQQDFDTGFAASPSVWLGTADNPDDDRVVVGDVEGNVVAMAAADGKVLWRHEIDGEIDAAVTFDGDHVLATSQDGTLVALDISDGSVRWTYQIDDQLRCSATVSDGQTFLGGCDAKLHRIDLKTGKSAGDPIAIDGPTGSTPASMGGKIVLPIMSGIVYGIDVAAGREIWRYEDETIAQEYRTDAAVDGTIAVVASARKNIDALSMTDGKRLWRYTLRRRSDASPLIVGDDVWIASTDGRLIRLDKRNGKEKWVHEIRGSFLSAPAIHQNRLYITDEDGIVRCFAANEQG